MDKDFKKEFPHEVKVNVNGFREYKGYSDLVTTYCASSRPCYYVVFPELEYEGYFGKHDIEHKKDGGDSFV